MSGSNFVGSVLRAQYFHSLAVEHSASRHPLSAGVVVSHLQDAVEALAYGVVIHLDLPVGQAPSFHQYWELVAKSSAGKQLPYRGEMSELNHLRVGFKHKGVPVSEQARDKYLAVAHRFLVETSSIFFSIDFDTLSEAEFVADEAVRSLLKAATASLDAGEFEESLKRCRDAMDVIEQDLTYVISPLHAPGPRLTSGSVQMEWVVNQLMNIEKALALTIVGVQPTDYSLVYSMLPLKSYGGTYQFTRIGLVPPINSASTAETVRLIVRIALQVEAASNRLRQRWASFAPK